MIKEISMRHDQKSGFHICCGDTAASLKPNSPENGPRLLFFSGGSALKNLSRELINHTHNSCHVITPFDSGGCSAKLRRAFDIPAVGDIRSRLLSLADRTNPETQKTVKLMSYRLPKNGAHKDLLNEFKKISTGEHFLAREVPCPARPVILKYLKAILKRLPENFCLKNASIGNMAIASAYMENGRNFEEMIKLFSRLLSVKGTICPSVDSSLHISAEYDNGVSLTGQHLITGKEFPTMPSKINRIFLCKTLFDHSRVRVDAGKRVLEEIRKADLICYPMGSFYSSIIASTLPEKIGEAISKNPCPKVFVPNTGDLDPEAFGMDLENLVSHLREHLSGKGAHKRVITHILLDKRKYLYKGQLNRESLQNKGIDIIDTSLVSGSSHPFIDDKLLIRRLMSIN